MTSKLDAQDQARVDKYLSSTIHQVERKPFQLGKLLLGIFGISVFMAAAAFVVGYFYNASL